MPAKVPEEVNHLFIKFMKEGNLEAVLDLYDPEIAFVNQAGEIKRGEVMRRQPVGSWPLLYRRSVYSRK